MIIWLSLFLLGTASAQQVPIVDEEVHVAPHQAKAVNLSLRQRAAVIEAWFEVRSGGPEVDVGLSGPGDGVLSPRGAPNQFLRLAPTRESGSFRYPARELGDYQVILDGRALSQEAVVHLRVSVSFDEAGLRRAAGLSAGRRSVTVATSLLFFLGVCWWPGRRLWRAFRSRPRTGLPPLF